MLSDAQLKQLVLDELQWDPKVNHAHIGVATDDGSVTLMGHVSSYADKFAALDAVKRVRGVKAIADEMDVHLLTAHRHDDASIAEHIAHVLEWNVSIPGNTVKATVHEGFVTLTGEVDFQHQRQHIESQVAHVGSVVGISNRIGLKTAVASGNVQKKIEEALARNAELEADNIKVSVRDDTVFLHGEVKALYERELAKNAAWKVPGVKHVEDHIRII
ncbi:MAG: BON domain-containing protein [Pseudomonadota bacterium]